METERGTESEGKRERWRDRGTYKEREMESETEMKGQREGERWRADRTYQDFREVCGRTGM